MNRVQIKDMWDLEPPSCTEVGAQLMAIVVWPGERDFDIFESCLESHSK